MFEKEKINNFLKTEIIGRNILTFDEITSTNIYLKNLKIPINGLTVLAENQTLGYGRFNRKWISNKNENLLFSVLLKDEINNSTLLPIIISLSVAEAISTYCKTEAEVKWPNDVLINNKKISGILIETKKYENNNYFIIGIGINCNQINFEDEINHKASSIFNETKIFVLREELFAKVINQIENNVLLLKNGNTQSLILNWQSKCKMFGKKLSVKNKNEIIFGTANSIDEFGLLNFTTLNGEEIKLSSGEVTFNLNLKENYHDFSN